jgi:hypothetical protein
LWCFFVATARWLFIDRLNKVVFGSSEGGAYRIHAEVNASYFGQVGSLSDMQNQLGCTERPNPNFPIEEIKWTEEHECQLFYIAGREKDGQYLRWARTEKGMVGAGGY